MAKLRLTIDELQVESFATGADGSARGTVRAQSYHTAPGGYECTNPWCAGQTGFYCGVATDAGDTCDSTQLQIMCGCTAGQTACDTTCGPTNNFDPTCAYGAGCPDYTNDAHCPTNAGYIGC